METRSGQRVLIQEDFRNPFVAKSALMHSGKLSTK